MIPKVGGLEKTAKYMKHYWPLWIKELKASPSNTLFLHGVSGSELVNGDPSEVIWVDAFLYWKKQGLKFTSFDPNFGSRDTDGYCR